MLCPTGTYPAKTDSEAQWLVTYPWPARGKNLREKADWPHELDQDNEIHDAWTTDKRQPQRPQFTPKFAQSCAGRTSWFAFQERQSMIG